MFSVKDGKLELIAKQKTKGAVYSLTSFNGKLLAAINQNIQWYRWILRDDGSGELQSECWHRLHILATLYVQTWADFIVVGDPSSVSLVYKVFVFLGKLCSLNEQIFMVRHMFLDIVRWDHLIYLCTLLLLFFFF